MSSLNQATLIGNVGRDPEIRHTQDGAKIANLSLATSERWNDKNSGEQRERTEWHRVVIFGEALARIAEKYVKKGSRICVVGQIQTHKWTDQGGTERYTTEIVLRGYDAKLVLLGERGGGADRSSEGDGSSSYGNHRGGGGSSKPREQTYDDLDDEIPF